MGDRWEIQSFRSLVPLRFSFLCITRRAYREIVRRGWLLTENGSSGNFGLGWLSLNTDRKHKEDDSTRQEEGIEDGSRRT